MPVAIPSEGMVQRLQASLAEVVGNDDVFSDERKTSYERDLTGAFHGDAALVVRPRTVAEVCEVLRRAARFRLPVVAQGGHTGLAGGGTPRDGELVLSLQHLGEIGPVDPLSGQITVGAGVTLESVQQAARAAGLDFPVDFGARGTATLGGMAATNAGGSLVFRYGATRAHVVGLEAVCVDGRVLSSLIETSKQNAGLDLSGLLVGSEGILAVLTRLRLRLVPFLPRRLTVLLGLAGLAQALDVLRRVREAASTLQAVDYFESDGLRLVCERFGLPQPFRVDYPVYLVLEFASRTDPMEDVAAVAALDVENAVAVDDDERRRLWSYRELHNEAIRLEGVPHKLDVAVPVGTQPAFEDALRRQLARARPEARLILYGHLADGNVHVNLLDLPSDESEVDEMVLRLATRFGGSISAEHGVGRAKARFLSLSRSEAEIAVMREIKSIFDPAGLLGPGRVLPEAMSAASG